MLAAHLFAEVESATTGHVPPPKQSPETPRQSPHIGLGLVESFGKLDTTGFSSKNCLFEDSLDSLTKMLHLDLVLQGPQGDEGVSQWRVVHIYLHVHILISLGTHAYADMKLPSAYMLYT